jgi:hypothetical protein
VFSDTGQDGICFVETAGTRPRQVISGLHTALGLLWYRDSLYVASAGRIDAYSGFDGQQFGASVPVLTLPSGVGEVNELVSSRPGT